MPEAKPKQLPNTIHDAAHYRAWLRQQSRCRQRHRRLRQSTVELVFSHLLDPRRTNVRGHGGAHKTVRLTAIACNLKSYLSTGPSSR